MLWFWGCEADDAAEESQLGRRENLLCRSTNASREKILRKQFNMFVIEMLDIERKSNSVVAC